MGSTQTPDRAAIRPQPRINWQSVVGQRTDFLHLMARATGVRYTDNEAIALVAITVERDVAEARRQLETMTRPQTAPSEVRRGTITAIGMIELSDPGGRHLLLKRGNEAWLVRDEPDGWARRKPWLGDINSVRWVGGPPAIVAFLRVGGPI